MWEILRFTGLTAAILISAQVYAQPPDASTPGPTPAVQQPPVNPIPFNSAPPPQAPPPGSPGYAPPPPPSDTREGFSYAPSAEYEGFSVVYPTDGTPPVHVSTTFLEVNLRAARTDAGVLQNIKNYENMNADMAENFMSRMFPDAGDEATPVQKTALQGTDRDIIIEPDPLAGPYARMTVTDKEGNVISEASLNSRMAAQILNQPYLSAEEKIKALSRPGFYLPENARQNFKSLTPEELEALVLESPDVQKQEFIRAAKVIAAEKAKKSDRETPESSPDADADGTTETEREVSESRAERILRETTSPNLTATAADKNTTAGMVESDRAEEDSDFWIRTSQSKTPLVVGALVALIAIGAFGFGIYRSRQ